MSFAYKLWKIGKALTREDILNTIKDEDDLSIDEEHFYVEINFLIKNNKILKITLKENSISKQKMFFTEKIGGSGDGIFYLYPNLKIREDTLDKKILQLVNTLKNIIIIHASEKNKEITKIILEKILPIKDYLELVKLNLKLQRNSDNEKLKKTLRTLRTKIKNFDEDLLALSIKILNKPKANYWFWFSINDKTFYELMPEIWENWFENPVIKNDYAKQGFDAFTNKETEVGFRPEIKVFSYDNYHSSLKYRINENFPLSLESARNIKFAWMYIRKNLLFKYKNLEYVILPNLLADDPIILRKILERFRRANAKTAQKNNVLSSLRKNEKKLLKEIEKLQNSKKPHYENKLVELQQKYKKVAEELTKNDLGMITEFDDELKRIGNLKHSITVDYIFTHVNTTNLSFEIKGSIDDVLPSHVSTVVKAMEENNVSDLITLKNKNVNVIYLQDFFNRDELFFIKNRSIKNNTNRVLKEKLYLVKLLLTDEKIKRDDLLKRFEKNREYNYDNKKRILNDGIKEWISYPAKFVKAENVILKFLTSLNKIKD